MVDLMASIFENIPMKIGIGRQRYIYVHYLG